MDKVQEAEKVKKISFLAERGAVRWAILTLTAQGPGRAAWPGRVARKRLQEGSGPEAAPSAHPGCSPCSSSSSSSTMKAASSSR